MAGVSGIAGRRGSPAIESLPVLDAPTLLHWIGGRKLVSGLRSNLGLPVELFERDLRPLIHGYAEFVQLLPATESGHHAEPGGLLQHGLETAGFALDAGRGRIHSLDASREPIGGQATRWNYAVIIAAFLNGIAAALDRLRVTVCQPGGHTRLWSPRDGSVGDAGAASR